MTSPQISDQIGERDLFSQLFCFHPAKKHRATDSASAVNLLHQKSTLAETLAL